MYEIDKKARETSFYFRHTGLFFQLFVSQSN